MYFLDSHIHLQDYKTQEVKNVVNIAAKNNVTRFINVSAHPSDWQAVKKIANQYSQIIPAFGVHPWYIKDVSDDWQDELERYLLQNPRALVGECGIDCLKNNDTQLQINVLSEQIELAKKYCRPLIIHAVKANYEFSQLFSSLPKCTVFHSFTGSAEWGREIQKHGFFIGINFSILRKKNYAEILSGINIGKILLETDGPYQNNTNGETLPQNLPFLAERIAECLGISLTEFSDILADNQKKFLGE